MSADLQDKFIAARIATSRLRDFAREHGMDFRQRDPLVVAIHHALDEAEQELAASEAARQQAEQPRCTLPEHVGLQPRVYYIDQIEALKKAEAEAVDLRAQIARLHALSENVEAFLKIVEWTDSTSETDAGNLIEECRAARVPPPQEAAK